MALTLTFLGAAGNVTGSRYLVETAGAKVLVDCGMFQERENLGRNWQDYGVDPRQLDAIVVTHGHMDHCAWLPKLVKDGYRGHVYATAATADLLPVIVRDSARIQVEDAKTKAKRHAREKRVDARPPVPLYDSDDAEKALAMVQPVADYDREVMIAPEVSASWGENGHILGAAWIALTAEGRRIVFSGDIGCWDRPILNDPEPPRSADYLMIESTYGDREHVDADVEKELAEIVREAAADSGNLLIPSFSVERAQELLYVLSGLRDKGVLKHDSVYLDSPMASRVIDVFNHHQEVYDEEMRQRIREGRSPFSFPGLRLVATPAESKQINAVRNGAIIIAGNGMCTGGRIKHHLAHNLERPETTLLFVGYQAPGTLGRQILEGADEVRLFNRRVKVRARVRQLGGFSGHADQRQLLRWAKTLRQPPKHCFVTHGEPASSRALADKLAADLGWAVSTPALMDQAALA